MSKRKPATASKHAHGRKIVTKAQQAAQAIVRSPRDSLRSAEAGPTESPPNSDNDLRQKALLVDNTAILHDDRKQTMTGISSKEETNLSSATANVRAYQANLLEMAQASMRLSFEFAQRLATIRSPLEFPSVIAEFTSKRVAMFLKHSIEMAKITTKR